ncbi:hypothetical protein [Thioflexithrix psekupsensis]|uniref:Uncharacterized protein n=1 Tax=Thioflexithrix psekupsensis TaxID=1570016 RepID=A0A251XD55_9GAMM|nr:hypothetical protein [Thioflexithrix psekupsensis]OUD16305.1 hypothetical protein TPSD3_00870 [Thioflexithrix psekupsensis]
MGNDEELRAKIDQARKHCRVHLNPHENIQDLYPVEQQVDKYLSFFRKHIEAMGGKFEVTVTFPELGETADFTFSTYKPETKPSKPKKKRKHGENAEDSSSVESSESS